MAKSSAKKASSKTRNSSSKTKKVASKRGSKTSNKAKKTGSKRGSKTGSKGKKASPKAKKPKQVNKKFEKLIYKTERDLTENLWVYARARNYSWSDSFVDYMDEKFSKVFDEWEKEEKKIQNHEPSSFDKFLV
jgi:hypothetical protein